MAGGLKEVRERISSVMSTQQITSAMKMVSAAKLKKASDAISEMRPYSLKLNEMLSHLMEGLKGDESLASLSFAAERPAEKVLICLITSDRGLCGAFNANLIKKVRELTEGKYASSAQAGKLHILTVGKRGNDAFKNSEFEVNNEFGHLFHELNFENSSNASEYMMEKFLDGTYDAIEIVYARFKNAAVQYIESEKFLPVKLSAGETESKIKADYIFEPEKGALVRELVPKILKTQFYRYLLDNNASEHGARMMAMEQATENANELLKELRLSYNRARQAAITTEISEIVGGAAALGG